MSIQHDPGHQVKPSPYVHRRHSVGDPLRQTLLPSNTVSRMGCIGRGRVAAARRGRGYEG
eukprot:7245174-Alexandrium_andersonii.AAC.1